MTNTWNCAKIRSRLSGYHDEAIPPDLASAIRAHLRGCADCTRELEAIARIARSIRASACDAPSGFEERLAARIAATEQTRRNWAARGRLAKRLSLASAAALLAATIGLGPGLLRDFSDPGADITDDQILDLALFGPASDEREGAL
jgi:anti-sigma factor (TIGR02949 family)